MPSNTYSRRRASLRKKDAVASCLPRGVTLILNIPQRNEKKVQFIESQNNRVLVGKPDLAVGQFVRYSRRSRSLLLFPLHKDKRKRKFGFHFTCN